MTPRENILHNISNQKSLVDSTMKHTLLTALLLLAAARCCNAQKVISVDYPNQADVKVFVVDYPNQADLLVYKVKYENQAGKNDGKWFFVKYQNQADKKIYFTEYASQADLKIYFVQYENQAGWNRKEKMALFY
ncbi:MAG: hypothetical protein RL021_854 [Bacteroidota bacterium]